MSSPETGSKLTALRSGYYAALACYFGSWVVLARGYRPEARLLPIAVGITALLLIAVRLLAWRFDASGDGDSEYAATAPPDADTRRAAVAFGWLAALMIAVVGIGLVPGIGAVTAAFIATYDTPRRAVGVGVGTAAVVYVLFVVLLDLPAYEPLATRLLGGVLGG